MSKRTQFVTTVIGLCLFYLAFQLRAQTVEVYQKVSSDAERYYLPPPAWLQAFSLGYNEAVADAVWIKSIIYFGGIAGANWETDEGSMIYTVNYLSTAAELDPKFRGLYYTGSKLTLYQKGNITLDTVLMAIEILQKGRINFPDDGEISFGLGFLHYYEVANSLELDADPVLLKKHKDEGMRLFRHAAFAEGAPRYAALLSSTLLSKEGLDEIAIEHLRSLLFKETDPTIRRSLEFQLRRLWGEAAERDIQTATQTHEKWTTQMPYVDFDLFLLLSRVFESNHSEVLDPLHLPNQSLGLLSNDLNG